VASSEVWNASTPKKNKSLRCTDSKTKASFLSLSYLIYYLCVEEYPHPF
jgi:hypothetical protein